MSPQARDATIQHFSTSRCCAFWTPPNYCTSVNNVDVTVFLVSLKAGGVALNLTEASRVYLMDSWWNPAVSVASSAIPRSTDFDISYPARSSIVSQRRSRKLIKIRLTLLAEAMDRIHRLGQRRPVQAIKLVVEDSIESRIVQVTVPRRPLWLFR
jgi:DNA repair protein RAD16